MTGETEPDQARQSGTPGIVRSTAVLGVNACDQCPFRVSANFVYDRDAMESLDDGWEPSCHKLVGVDAIFHEPFPQATRCRGHDAWIAGEHGFLTPNVELSGSDRTRAASARPPG